jgi:glutaredoxin-like YruB-family protein
MKNVTIYSTPTCHYCKEAKAFFQEKGIAYAEHDVAADLEQRKQMIDKSGQMGVPVIVIGDEVIVGFDQEAIEAAIK